MLKNKKKIINGSIIDIAGNVFSSIVSFVFIKFYFNIITKEEYGIWLAINGVASLIGLVDIGVDQYLITQLSNNALFSEKKINTTLSNSVLIKTVIALLFVIIGITVFVFLPQFISIPPIYLQIAKATFTFNLIYLVVNIFFNTSMTILIARNHFTIVNSIMVIGSIVNSFVVFILLKIGLGIISFPLTLLIIGVLQFLIMIMYIRKKYPHIRLGGFNFHGQKEMISYSFSFQVTKIAYVVRNQYLFIAINNIVGPVYVTLYSITNRIPQMVGIYLNKIVNPFFPTFCEFVNNNENEKLKFMVIKLTKFLVRYSIFFCIGVFFLNEKFITIWVGNDKYSGNYSLFWLLIFTFITSSFCGFGIIIYATKKFEKLPIISIFESLITIFLTYLLGTKYGFIGVLAGFVTGSCISQFYIAYISFKQIGLTFKHFIKESYFYIFFPNVISLLTISLITHFFDIRNLFTLLFSSLAYFLSNFLIIEIPKMIKSENVGFFNKLKFAFKI